MEIVMAWIQRSAKSDDVLLVNDSSSAAVQGCGIPENSWGDYIATFGITVNDGTTRTRIERKYKWHRVARAGATYVVNNEPTELGVPTYSDPEQGTDPGQFDLDSLLSIDVWSGEGNFVWDPGNGNNVADDYGFWFQFTGLTAPLPNASVTIAVDMKIDLEDGHVDTDV